MSNEERFWESSIAEAVRRDTPPDVTPRVLAELADDVEPEPPQKEVKPRGRVLRVIARYGLEIAAAAAVVLAIAWGTGLVRFGGPDEVTEAKSYAASPRAVVVENKDFIELKRGWLLVTTGVPEVRRQGSKLTDVDGRVLLHAGEAPSREQIAAVKKWLNANELEEDMITNPKRWMVATALAAMVLTGSANLDGERIEAQEEDEAAEVVWHTVRSVMDIDNLPEGAEYVNADGINTAHLDFLVEVETLRGISVRGGYGLKPGHLEALGSLPKLEWLDIRRTQWSDYKSNASAEGLKDISTLTYVGMDLIPANLSLYGKSSQDYDYERSTLPTLSSLSERGVEIELGLWRPQDHESLRRVLNGLPTLTAVMIDSASIAEMKVLAEFDRLQSISLSHYDAGEIGLAYLSRKAFVKKFDIKAGELSLEEIHQISRMGLHSLTIDAEIVGSPRKCFALLAKMPNLRELELTELELTDDGARGFASFSGMSSLTRLRIGNDVLDSRWELALMLAHHVPTRRLEIAYDDLNLPAMNQVPAWMPKGKSGTHLEEIRFDVYSADFYRDNYGDEYIAPLKTYPNLKRIEIRRGGFNEPAEEDEFVRWLKEGLPDVEVVVTP